MPLSEIRPARPEDREPILAFCRDTWEWGDYIDLVWDTWLNDPAGRLFAATIDEQPIGICHMRMMTSVDAWLEGLRVHPDYRHLGIARQLNEAALLEAMRRNATYARLMIDSTNTRSIQISESAHMRRVAGVALFTVKPFAVPTRAQEETQLATSEDLDEIIDYLNVSNIFPLTGGLYYVTYAAYPITSEMLEEKIAAQQVYLLRRWNRLDGLAIAEPRDEHWDKHISVGYIDGTTIEAISLIGYDLRRRLPELKLESARVYVPDLVLPREAFTALEYNWDGTTYYIYERGLT